MYSQKEPEGIVENDQGYSQKRLGGIVENDQGGIVENDQENKKPFNISSSKIFEKPKIHDNEVKKQKGI